LVRQLVRKEADPAKQNTRALERPGVLVVLMRRRRRPVSDRPDRCRAAQEAEAFPLELELMLIEIDGRPPLGRLGSPLDGSDGRPPLGRLGRPLDGSDGRPPLGRLGRPAEELVMQIDRPFDVESWIDPPPIGVVRNPPPPAANGNGRAGGVGDDTQWVPDGREGRDGSDGRPEAPAPVGMAPTAPAASANMPTEPAASRTPFCMRIIVPPGSQRPPDLGDAWYRENRLGGANLRSRRNSHSTWDFDSECHRGRFRTAFFRTAA
jgi:hypothetical protein